MTLQQLKYALTIADCGSMNEAAKQLFISQPSLSETMKELETEIGLDIFLRSNRGIVITPEGEEFLGYARQVTEQFGLLQSKYIDKKVKEKFSVSTQHYTFAVKAFVETVKQIGMEQYEFAVHETTTISVIENVKNFKSEIGVLYENDFNEKVLNKMFKENGLEFVELFSCDTFVYLWSGHPLAKQDVITMEELDEYPCLSFDQGKNNSLYLAEEMDRWYITVPGMTAAVLVQFCEFQQANIFIYSAFTACIFCALLRHHRPVRINGKPPAPHILLYRRCSHRKEQARRPDF